MCASVRRRPCGKARCTLPVIAALLFVVLDSSVSARAESACSIKRGDLNYDLEADICDFLALTSTYGAYDPCADLNDDGYVDAYDYIALSEIISREPTVCGGESLPLAFARPESGVVTQPFRNNSLIVVGKDDDWADRIYELAPDGTCLQVFGDEPATAQTYSRVRTDPQGRVVVLKLSGEVVRYEVVAGQVFRTTVIAEVPAVAVGLSPLDISFDDAGGLFVLYSVNPDVLETTVPNYSVIVQLDDQVPANVLNHWTHGPLDRARDLVRQPSGRLMVTNAHNGDTGDFLYVHNGLNFSWVMLGAPTAPILSPSGMCLNAAATRVYVGSAIDNRVWQFGFNQGVPTWPPTAVITVPGIVGMISLTLDPRTNDVWVTGVDVMNDLTFPKLVRVNNAVAQPPITPHCSGGDYPGMRLALGAVRYHAPIGPDLDQDADVDQSDFGLYLVCLSGPGIPPPDAACLYADFDSDGDIDINDFGYFQTCVTGAAIPADPNCDE